MTDQMLKPGSTIGIFGGGQLGRFLAISAARLGFNTHIFCPQHDAPAFDVASKHTIAPYGDMEKVKQFALGCDVVTFEFENIPQATLEQAALFSTIAPGTKSLSVCQDRLHEKEFLTELKIPVAPYMAVNKEADIISAIYKLGPEGLLKTRRLGYDGKGQIRLGLKSDPEQAMKDYGGEPAIFERQVSFQMEISCLAVRDFKGNIRFYDLPRNEHRHQVLAESHVPVNGLDADYTRLAEAYTAKIAEKLDYIGVLAVEFFVFKQGSKTPLLVNEIAPRVHNSGHWTIDACECSQFDNHIRAIAGWPLGSTSRHSNAMMANLIGNEIDRWHEIAGNEGAILHHYGKSQSRPGRKMGHVTYLYPKEG